MLPSFRTLFGPDVLPKPAIPPSFPRPHVTLRSNEPLITPSPPSSVSAAPEDASWYREQHPFAVTSDSAPSSSRPLANHFQQPHDGWVPHMTQQTPTAQSTQSHLSRTTVSPHAPNDRLERPHSSSSPPPSHSDSHSTSHPETRDRDLSYPTRFSNLVQGHHAPASSMHYRSSTLDSTVSSVSSPPHPATVGSETTPLAMEAMAAMTINPPRPAQTATTMDGTDSHVDTRNHCESTAAGYQGRPAASGIGSVPNSPSRGLVRLSITENRGSSVSPPRRSYPDLVSPQSDLYVSRTTPPLYHDSKPSSLLGAEFHPPPDMDIDRVKTPSRGSPHEHDQISPHPRPSYPPTSLLQGSPRSHTKPPSSQSQWTVSSALQAAGSYSPKDHAFQETCHAQSYHRPPSVQGPLYPTEARTGASDDGALHHRPGHYQSQAYSQSHPSLHDQSHHQRMHDPVRVSDQRTHPPYPHPHPSSSLPSTTSPPSSRPAHPSYPPSFSVPPNATTPASPLSPPSGYAWTSTTQNGGLEAPPPPPHGSSQQAVSPRMSKNHDGLVHRSSHSSLPHHPDRYATSSPSLRGVSSAGHGYSSQHLRQASAGLPIGHASRSASDHVVSPTASYAYSHSPAHPGIRRPHSARPISELHPYGSSAQESGSHLASLPHSAGSHDYPIGHATRPSPYPPRRRTESVPSSPQFSHARTDRSWAEPHRHDIYAEKFSRHQRSNTTHGHVGDGMYESFSKVLSSSELRDRPSLQSSANLTITPSLLPPPTHDLRKTSEAHAASHAAVRPSASEPDLERVHGGRPAAQTNGQADYWTKPSFDMEERLRGDRLSEARGVATPFRKDTMHSRTQDEHDEQDEVDDAVDEEGEEEGEDEEEGLDDDDGEDDDQRHAWAQQDYDDTQGRMHHSLNHEGYRYGDVPYSSHQAHGPYNDSQHPPDVDGQISLSHPPLYAPHPYQPLQQYLLRPQRISKSPKQKPLQPKNSQRGPYLTRQRVLASGMEPGKGTACRYVCSYCQKRFSRPSSLRIHTYSHTGERPFKCTEKGCERQFSVQSNMRRHLRVHRMDKIKFLDPIYPSQIANERPLQSRSQQQQTSPSQPQPPHPSPVDHRMVPPLPLIGTTAPTPIHS